MAGLLPGQHMAGLLPGQHMADRLPGQHGHMATWPHGRRSACLLAAALPAGRPACCLAMADRPRCLPGRVPAADMPPGQGRRQGSTATER